MKILKSFSLKSIGAIAAGFIAVAILSVITDMVLEKTRFFPPQDKPELYTGGLLLIALIYRCVYTVTGGYVTARLSPEKPMFHAMILAAIGTMAATIGAIANWDKTGESTRWYPIALVITAIPCIWFGALIFTKKLK